MRGGAEAGWVRRAQERTLSDGTFFFTTKPTRAKRRNTHTMNRRWNIVAAVALGIVAAVACAKAPQEDVDGAKAEMDKARQDQAETWAPNEYPGGDQAMDGADAEIQGRNAKGIKKLDKAKED